VWGKLINKHTSDPRLNVFVQKIRRELLPGAYLFLEDEPILSEFGKDDAVDPINENPFLDLD
jgi:hypothetical protein